MSRTGSSSANSESQSRKYGKPDEARDALLLDENSRSDTYPTIRIGGDDVTVGHEATVSKVDDEQLFYLMSHGIREDEASKLIVNGFIEPIIKELPMEYAAEMNRLIELQIEGSIG
jgi:Fe-S cluster assembly protein SufB